MAEFGLSQLVSFPTRQSNILDLIMKKYADASGRIKQDRILNAIKAFKSYLAQELTYKDLFAKCTWSTP